jgi:DNA-directed RNA polymerase specialized sigma24 family protein
LDSCVSYNISKHYNSWLNKAIGLAHCKNKGSDLLHEVLARLMDRPEQDVEDIVCRGKVEAYINRALWLSWHSNRSDYAMKYRKYYELHTEKEIADTKQDETWIGAFIDGEYLYNAIGRMNEFDAILLRLYSKPDFDYKTLSKETGIPYAYLRTSIHRALKRIREYVKIQRALAYATRETQDLQKL